MSSFLRYVGDWSSGSRVKGVKSGGVEKVKLEGGSVKCSLLQKQESTTESVSSFNSQSSTSSGQSWEMVSRLDKLVGIFLSTAKQGDLFSL